MCYGPEFSSAPFRDWLKRVGISLIQIYPGSPWGNGNNERFNCTLRREVLNAEWSAATRQAQTARRRCRSHGGSWPDAVDLCLSSSGLLLSSLPACGDGGAFF